MTTKRPPRSAGRVYLAEALEGRQLLSTISWVNRGTTVGTNADRFDTVFGTLAAQARSVVDAAITFWQRTIAHFNYGDGGADTYNLTVQMNATAIGSGPGGVGANGGSTATRNNKPSTGSMGIGWRSGITAGTNTAAGYFLDPTPLDSSEYATGAVDAFYATPVSGSAVGNVDLFSIALHEMGHAMGLASGSQTRAVAVNSGTADGVNAPASSPASTLWLVNNGSLWTSWDSGGATGSASNKGGPQHFAPAGTSAVVNGVTYYGANALMNAVGGSQRAFISDLEAGVLPPAYGYTINAPSQFGTMYGFVQADGKLVIDLRSLNNSNDKIAINADSGNMILRITEGTPIRGIDPKTQFTSIFPMAGITSVSIEAGDGDDAITLFAANIGSAIPITVNGGGGNDTLEIDGTTYDDDVSINFPVIAVAGKLNIAAYSGISLLRLELDSGNASLYAPDTRGIGAIRLESSPTSIYTTETVTVSRLDDGTPLTVETFGGDDTLYVGEGDLYAIKSSVTFLGDAGSDRLILNGAASTESSFYGLTGTSVDYSSLVTPNRQGSARYNSTLETLFVNAGPADDGFAAVVSLAGTTLNLNGDGGNDALSTGDAGSGVGLESNLGPINFYGGPDVDSIYIDDRAASANRTYTIGSNSIKNNVSAAIVFDAEAVTLDGVNAHFGTYNINGTASATAFTLDGGALADQFFLNNNDRVNVTLNGGGGSDGLTVDDRNSASNLFRMTLTSTTLVRDFGTPAAFTSYAATLINIDLPSYYANAYTNTLNIQGTPAGAYGYSFIVYGSSRADAFTLSPHDPVTGANTFLSPLDIAAQGGADTIAIDDSASPIPVHYTLSAPLGSPNFGSYLDAPGMPQLLLEAAAETLAFVGSAYDDSFDLASGNCGQFISILGGDGDDLATAGGDDIRNTLPRLGPYIYDGQNGTDAFALFNRNTQSAWTYTRDATYIQPNSTNYVVGFHENAENVTIASGAFDDVFLVKADGPNALARGGSNGFTDAFDGGAGSDQFLIGDGGHVEGITAAIDIRDAGAADAITINATAAPDAVVVHLFDNSVDAFPGDTLFGPGGTLSHGGVGSLTLSLAGGDDAVYAAPSTTTRIALNASTAAGTTDVLHLAFADAVNPVASDPGDGTARYDFDNDLPLVASGFDAIDIDDLAPAAIDAQFIVDAPVPMLQFTFNKNVAATLGADALLLTNSTTGETFGPADAVLSGYDAESQIATFTFPNLPGGTLPDGDYQAVLAPAYRDDSGNAAAAPFTLDFFVLAGDANRDRSVNFDDLLVLAQNYGQSGLTFSQGDFNYDGSVNFDDLLILAQRYGTSLAVAAPTLVASPVGPLGKHAYARGRTATSGLVIESDPRPDAASRRPELRRTEK